MENEQHISRDVKIEGIDGEDSTKTLSPHTSSDDDTKGGTAFEVLVGEVTFNKAEIFETLQGELPSP